MKPQIRLIDGLHLTATDKRNLLAVIEFERASPPEVWGTRWLGLPKSPKSYAVLPDPEKPGFYFELNVTNYCVRCSYEVSPRKRAVVTAA